MYGDEYELAFTERGRFRKTKCPECGNGGKVSKGEKRILEASPPVRDERGNIVKMHVDPPPAWDDGRRRFVCCECGYLGHAIEFKIGE